MKVSLDGGVTYVEAPEGVRIIYEEVMIPNKDDPGELHINATHEGLITDVWVSNPGELHTSITNEGSLADTWVPNNGSLDHNAGTSSELVDDIVCRLVGDEPDTKPSSAAPRQR